MTKHVFIYRAEKGEDAKTYIEPPVVSFEGRDEKPSIFFHAFHVDAEVDLSNLELKNKRSAYWVRNHESVEVPLAPGTDAGYYCYTVSVGGVEVGVHSPGPGAIIHPPMT